MSSLFDFDDSQEIVFQAKTAGKSLIAAKYDVLQATGEFLFNAHTDGEFVQRCEMVDDQISKIAYTKLSNISDSKTKLVKALHTEWSLRHAKCEDCTCGKNKKIAKTTCEMCADGELDSDSPLCKACRSKEASRKEAAELSLTPLGELVGAGAAGAAYLIQKRHQKKMQEAKDQLDGHEEDGDRGGHVSIVDEEDGGEKRPFDWERDASRTANSDGPVCDLCGDQLNEPDARISLQNNGGKFISCDNCDEAPQETELHDQLHEDWHRQHGDSPCTSVEDCKNKSRNYKNS